MENHDINYLISKYSKNPNNAKNEDFQSSSSPKSSFSPFRNPNSKAYAAAMRALHERIGFLERENAEMIRKYKTTEERLIEERKTNDRLRERLEDFEKYSNQNANELKQELMNMKKENSILHLKLKDNYNAEHLAQNKEKNYIKEELADFKKENQRLKNRIEDLETNELPKLYKENLHLKQDLDRIQRDFSDNILGETKNMQIKRMEDKIEMLRNEISKENQKDKNYYKENPDNKYNINKNQNNNRRENAILRQKEHFIRTIKDLEDQSRCYDDGFRPKSQAMGRSDDVYTSVGETDNQSLGGATTYRQRNGEVNERADTSPKRKKNGENSSSPSRRGHGYRFSPYDEDMKRGRTSQWNGKGKFRDLNEDDKNFTYRTVSFRGSKSKSKSRSKSSSPSSPNISRPANRHIGAHLNEYGFYGNKTEY
ncbi:hypothetical protein SteCoe_31498 [Stentor coeruleus]|uniref:Lebercilin domain-containing protein n=1 Tax=Stentor coeruleus TaxID=5963 RepID=A0A1R2B135_9CILI|nr:hypothetical protein SteCoe_31498 [Stentor coeruleus]